ncbi:hypothetical protein K438DRAFT_2114702 [Mycena galopus ATCC 62051]|nr:hypothetical protein K438DRAFT_2114702 [Mycena galopus ATCC 62051]
MQITGMTNKLETVKCTLGGLTSVFLCSDNGMPVMHFATKGDIGRLWDSIKESFNSLDKIMDEQLAPTIQKVGGEEDLTAKLELMTPRGSLISSLLKRTLPTSRLTFNGLDEIVDKQLAPTIQKLGGAAALTAKFKAQVAKLTPRCSREHCLQIDLSVALTGGAHTVLLPSTVVTPAAAVAAPLPMDGYTVIFLVGGKRLKCKASVELIAGPVKCASMKPDKNAYHHWVIVTPINPDTKHVAPPLFRKLLEMAGIKYSLLAAYIERAMGEPLVLNIGLGSAGDANGFVNVWSGAMCQMPAGPRGTADLETIEEFRKSLMLDLCLQLFGIALPSSAIGSTCRHQMPWHSSIPLHSTTLVNTHGQDRPSILLLGVLPIFRRRVTMIMGDGNAVSNNSSDTISFLMGYWIGLAVDCV